MGIKYLRDREWFLDNGVLVAINAWILHPLGLAAELNEDNNGEIILKIWDYRDDPEGFIYGDEGVAGRQRIEKLDNFKELMMKSFARRVEALGYFFQYKIPEFFFGREDE